MKLLPLTIIVIVLCAVLLGIQTAKKETTMNPFRDKNLFEKALGNPSIWIFLSDNDVSVRNWSDFQSSKAILTPFLNLCYESIQKANNGRYNVEVIAGLTELARRLGGWDAMPPSLQNPLATIGEAETNWIRAELLARFGGMWMQPSTLCLRPLPMIAANDVVFFGHDESETYAPTELPSMTVMGVGKANHPVFEAWAKSAKSRLASDGKQIREDAKWDFITSTKGESITVFPDLEVSRKPDGRRIQLEDLLAAGQEGAFSFKVSSEAIYVPIPWSEIMNRRAFGWFLRMSEEQILASDLVISDLFRATQS